MWECVYSWAWAGFVKYLKEKCHNSAQLVVNPTLILFGHSKTVKTGIGFYFILFQVQLFAYKCTINKTIHTMFFERPVANTSDWWICSLHENDIIYFVESGYCIKYWLKSNLKNMIYLLCCLVIAMWQNMVVTRSIFKLFDMR